MDCDEAAGERSCSEKRKECVKGEQMLAFFTYNLLFLKAIHQNIYSGQIFY